MPRDPDGIGVPDFDLLRLIPRPLEGCSERDTLPGRQHDRCGRTHQVFSNL